MGVPKASLRRPGPTPKSETQEHHHSCPSCVWQDILNHVFDDVESFVSRLQKSAEAARVLEHRERGRRTRRRAAGGKRPLYRPENAPSWMMSKYSLSLGSPTTHLV